MSPAVSVVIPTFNASKKIHVSLDSLLSQTFQDFEVIIVDDCSDDYDELLGILELPKYAALQIRTSRADEKLYASGARNKAFELAKGEFVALLDADDEWLPDKLTIAVNRLKELEADGKRSVIIHSLSNICRGDMTIKVMPKGPIAVDESVAEYLFGPRGWIQTSTLVLRTDDARRIMFDPRFHRHQDFDFCIRADKAGYSFALLSQPLVRYNVDPNAFHTKGETIEYIDFWLEEMRPYLNRRDLFTYRAYQMRRIVAIERSWLAAAFLFVTNFPFTSWRNQKAFVQLIGEKLFRRPRVNRHSGV